MRCLRSLRRGLAPCLLSRGEPSRALGAEFLYGPRLVLGHVLRCEGVRPAPVDSLVDEYLGTIVPGYPPERYYLLGVALHPPKRAVLEDLLPPRLVDGDLQELGDAAHLVWHIPLEVGEVHEHDVREVAHFPPGAHVLPERPEGVAVAIHPVAEVPMDIRGGRLYGWSYAPRAIVECVVPELVRPGVVVVHAPHDVAPVAPDVDVLRLGREDEGVDGKVGLHEPPVGLRLHHRNLHFLGGHAQIEPGRYLRHLEVGIRTQEHLGYDLLGPGGSGLGIGRDDYVVVAKAEVVPHSRVEVVVVQLPALCGPNDGFGHEPSLSVVAGHLPAPKATIGTNSALTHPPNE